MATVKLPYTLQGGQKAVAKYVMANFEAVINGFNAINKELVEVTSNVDEFNKKPTIAAFTIFPSLVGKAPVGAYPLWTGEQVINARTLFKDFWNKALEYSKAGHIRVLAQDKYDEEIKEYGQTGAFVIDELNGHIRLPKIIGFLGGLSDIANMGVPQKDGIPKLEGEFYIPGNAVQGVDASGVFKKGTKGRPTSGYGMGQGHVDSIALDISEQINVTEEVQPRHVKVAWYIQVANNLAEISTLDTSVIVGLLNDSLQQLTESKATAITAINELALTKTNEIGSTVNNLIIGIHDESDKQIDLVQQAGTDLVSSGNNQVVRVTSEGNAQVARIVQTVTDEVDDKLVVIQESAQQIYDAGTSQLAAVNQAGEIQTNNAKQQADRAEGYADSIDPSRFDSKADISLGNISSNIDYIIETWNTDNGTIG